MTAPLNYKNPGPSCTCDDYGDPGPSHLPNCPGYRSMTAPIFPKDELELMAKSIHCGGSLPTDLSDEECVDALRSAISSFEALQSRAEEAERKLATFVSGSGVITAGPTVLPGEVE